MRQVFRDAALDAEFGRHGFVQMPMLSAAEIEGLNEASGGLRPDDGFAPVPPAGSSRSYHCSFLDRNLDYRRRTFDLLTAAFAPHVERVLAGYTIHQCNFYVKPPRRGAFDIHQNWPQLTDLDDVSVTLWCPLVDVSEANGAIGLVPGSHKILPYVQTPGVAAYFVPEDVAASGLFRSLAVRAGEAVIFDDSMIHGSPANVTAEARIAVQLICRPVDAVPAYWRRDGDDLFELIHADCDFWLEHQVEDLLRRPREWQSLGHVRSRNRPIALPELRELLARGEEIRAAGFRMNAIRLSPAARLRRSAMPAAKRALRRLARR